MDFSTYYYHKKDVENFRYWNRKLFRRSKNISDSIGMAESFFDRANCFYRRHMEDSSYYYYYKASKYFLQKKDLAKAGRVTYNMSAIQRDLEDYLGAEVTTTNAIKLLKGQPDTEEDLYLSYNNLGIIHNDLGEYEKALKYHSEALGYIKNKDKPVLKATSLNNIGVIYEYQKDYKNAIGHFKYALKIDSLEYKEPRLYAMLLDNLAYSRAMMGETENILPDLFKALKIRDSIEHTSGKINNIVHLGEYYLKLEDTSTAICYFNEAKSLSEKNKGNTGHLLKSLLFLARLDKEHSSQYLLQHIKISDSLQVSQRSVQNRFASIRFETNEFIKKNKQLNSQQNWMLIGSIGGFLVLVLLYIIRVQTIRNSKLKLEKQQQIANEEIYNLMITSQKKLEQGKLTEKKRISKELHDNILSKFFGIRINLELLNSRADEKAQRKRNEFLDQLKSIESELRNISHELNEDFIPDVSFVDIIQDLIKKQERIGNYTISVSFDEDIVWEKINNKVKIHLYRILQEALHNINKHSRAAKVLVAFEKTDGVIDMTIKDNGVGFDPAKVKKGIGLSNIAARVNEMKGDFSIFSVNEGTRLVIKIPI